MNDRKQVREPPIGGSLNFSHIIDDFTWSYSRIKAFEMCKYGFFLSYIKPTGVKKRNFFSDYGSFIHKILEKYYKGELRETELLNYFLINYHKEVQGVAPNDKIFANYFMQGVKYFENFAPITEGILGVEKKVRFSVQGRNFVGFVDKVSVQDGNLIITDNKSHNLKSRSNRTNPTKSDVELDDYLRQPYLYSIPIKSEYGQYPDYLAFNCFRSQTEIVEPFNKSALEEAKGWAIGSIEKIRSEKSWEPNIDFFKCKYICDHSDECEYFQMS